MLVGSSRGGNSGTSADGRTFGLDRGLACSSEAADSEPPNSAVRDDGSVVLLPLAETAGL